MPHLGSNTIRALYDVSVGGPPVGYQCQIKCYESFTETKPCLRVVRTLRGMKTHQRVVHGVTEQSEFNFEEIKATV